MARVTEIIKKFSSIQYIPTNTSIMIIRHREKNLYKELYKHNILVSDLSNTQGLEGKKYVRITIREDKHMNNQLIKVLQKIEQGSIKNKSA